MSSWKEVKMAQANNHQVKRKVSESAEETNRISEDVVEGRPPQSPGLNSSQSPGSDSPQSPEPDSPNYPNLGRISWISPPKSPTPSSSEKVLPSSGWVCPPSEKELREIIQKRMDMPLTEFLKPGKHHKFVVGGERAKALVDIYQSIDHTKRKSFCEGYYCVYDSRLVRKSYDIRAPKENYPANYCPLDDSAPFGGAYYDEEWMSPLIEICRHDNCQPNQALTYMVIKILNQDDRLGYAPNLENVFLNKRWSIDEITLIRNHHRRGETVVRRMEKLAKKFAEDTEIKDRDNFLIDFLRAARKMPYVIMGFPQVDLDNAGSLVKLIREGGWKSFWNNINGEVTPQQIINQSEQHCIEQYAPLMMNLYRDCIVDLKPELERTEGQAMGIPDEKRKYLPIDLIRTWSLVMEHDGFLPTAFFAKQRIPLTVARPISSRMSYRELLQAFDEREAEALKIRLYAPKIGLDNGEQGKDLFALEENKSMVVTYDIKRQFGRDNILNNTTFFIRRANMSSKEVGFAFTGMYLEYMIDSIIDFFILNLRDLDSIKFEMDSTDRYNRYLEGYSFKPNDGFKHQSRLHYQMLDQTRDKNDFMIILRGMNRACIGLQKGTGKNIEMVRHFTTKEGSMKFEVTADELLVVLKKLCRFHMMLNEKLGLKGFGKNAFRYAVVRLNVAYDFLREYKRKESDPKEQAIFVTESYIKWFKNFEKITTEEVLQRSYQEDEWDVFIYREVSNPNKRCKVDDLQPKNVCANTM